MGTSFPIARPRPQTFRLSSVEIEAEFRGTGIPSISGMSGHIHARHYPALGVILSLGAPGGLLLLEAAIERAVPSPAWVLDQIDADAATYAYLTLSTSVVFAVLGVILGRLVDRLEEWSLHDELTGLGNRRLFDQRIREEMNRSIRYETALSLLMIDLDGLKEINDRKGHAAGDEALVHVADALLRSCRATDIPARSGGDEFAVIAPNTKAEDALRLAERIRGALDGTGVSVSIGVADVEGSTADVGALSAAADRALYDAKAKGRDQVIASQLRREAFA
jgi:diguanylate cyclase (GGDEF)-like protein